MAGNVNQQTASRSRYLPKGYALSWWMLAVTTGAILITSIDRVLLPTVLPGILKEFDLGETAGGVLVGLSFAGTMTGRLVLGVFGDSLGKGVRRAWTWAVAVAIVVASAVATAVSRTLLQLQVLRFIMGVGTGGWSPSTSRWSASGGRRRTGASPSARTTPASPSASSSGRYS